MNPKAEAPAQAEVNRRKAMANLYTKAESALMDPDHEERLQHGPGFVVRDAAEGPVWSEDTRSLYMRTGPGEVYRLTGDNRPNGSIAIEKVRSATDNYPRGVVISTPVPGMYEEAGLDGPGQNSIAATDGSVRYLLGLMSTARPLADGEVEQLHEELHAAQARRDAVARSDPLSDLYKNHAQWN